MAKLEAENYKCKLGTTELELAKQLDSLQELQWRLDFVVSHLGLQPGPETKDVLNIQGVCNADLLLNKVREHALVQEQAECYKAELAVTKAERDKLQQQCMALQQQVDLNTKGPVVPGAACTVEAVTYLQRRNGISADISFFADEHHNMGEVQIGRKYPAQRLSQQLIETLLRENEELHSKLLQYEEQSQLLQQEMDADILLKMKQNRILEGSPDIAEIMPMLKPVHEEGKQSTTGKHQESISQYIESLVSQTALSSAIQTWLALALSDECG